MPTLAISLSNISAASNQTRTATYTKVSGPNWTGVESNGDIDVSNPSGNSPNVNISWTLPDEFTFATVGFTAVPASADFAVDPLTNGGMTLTVSDTNNDPSNTTYTYTLHLSDGTQIDPRIINH